MPRTTAAAAEQRRHEVELMLLRGQRPAAIARALSADPRTVKRDIAALVIAWQREADVRAERQRLLAAARTVEAEAWTLHSRLPADDVNGQLGALGKALAAQERSAALLGQIEAATLADELAELRGQVAALADHAPGRRLRVVAEGTPA